MLVEDFCRIYRYINIHKTVYVAVDRGTVGTSSPVDRVSSSRPRYRGNQQTGEPCIQQQTAVPLVPVDRWTTYLAVDRGIVGTSRPVDRVLSVELPEREPLLYPLVEVQGIQGHSDRTEEHVLLDTVEVGVGVGHRINLTQNGNLRLKPW